MHIQSAPADRYCYCHIHNRECDVTTSVAMANISGSICCDHSTMGTMDRDQAMSYAHLLIWAGQRRICQEPIIVQECVDTFPRDQFVDLLPQYDWSWAILSPHQHGFPIRRLRQWAIGRHKTKTLSFRSLLNIFSASFVRPKNVDWRIFFWENLGCTL